MVYYCYRLRLKPLVPKGTTKPNAASQRVRWRLQCSLLWTLSRYIFFRLLSIRKLNIFCHFFYALNNKKKFSLAWTQPAILRGSTRNRRERWVRRKHQECIKRILCSNRNEDNWVMFTRRRQGIWQQCVYRTKRSRSKVGGSWEQQHQHKNMKEQHLLSMEVDASTPPREFTVCRAGCDCGAVPRC